MMGLMRINMSKLGCMVGVLGVMVLDVLGVMVLEIHQDFSQSFSTELLMR